ncbi:MAG TPA: hypothetical protein VL484_04010 [Vicinamibacterales bacterium]|nr:hypothetical protein [Vicinamibacterales bacterium]
MRALLRIGAFIVLVPLVGACASASAKTKPVELPPLAVPPPPPRVIEPVPAPEPGPEPVADLPPAPANHPVRQQPKETKEQPKAPETKPPADTPPAQPDTPPPAPVPQPPAQLRTPATANDTEAENGIRGAIERGRNLLSVVNYAALSNERKKAYNDAKMLLDQAESALKQGNYTFAQGVASKGETLAHDLAGR